MSEPVTNRREYLYLEQLVNVSPYSVEDVQRLVADGSFKLGTHYFFTPVDKDKPVFKFSALVRDYPALLEHIERIGQAMRDNLGFPRAEPEMHPGAPADLFTAREALVVTAKSHPKVALRRTPGFVYLFSSAGLYKIGKSTNPAARVRALNGASATHIAVEHTFPAEHSGNVEVALHQLFKSRRRRGEWFELSERDIRMVKAITFSFGARAAIKKKIVVGVWGFLCDVCARKHEPHFHYQDLLPIERLEEALAA